MNQGNPYAAPDVEVTGSIDQLSQEKLRQVAVSQKTICIYILVYLGFIVLSFYAIDPDIFGVLSIIFLILSLVVLVAVVSLAIRIYGLILGILVTVLMFVPLLNLLLLLMLNVRATRMLKEHGIRVGLLGAYLADLKRKRQRMGFMSERCP